MNSTNDFQLEKRMTIEEGVKLLEDAYKEFDMASNMAKIAKGKTFQRYELEMNLIRNRVNNIFKTCPQLNSYIDYKDVFFNSVFFKSDLQRLIEIIKQDLDK